MAGKPKTPYSAREKRLIRERDRNFTALTEMGDEWRRQYRHLRTLNALVGNVLFGIEQKPESACINKDWHGTFTRLQAEITAAMKPPKEDR